MYAYSVYTCEVLVSPVLPYYEHYYSESNISQLRQYGLWNLEGLERTLRERIEVKRSKVHQSSSRIRSISYLLAAVGENVAKFMCSEIFDISEIR